MRRTMLLAGVVASALAIAGPIAAAEYQLRIVASVGDRAPAGGVLESFSTASLPTVTAVNRRGDVAFFAKVGRPVAGRVLFLGTGAGLVRIAGKGDHANPAGVIVGFGREHAPALNGRGLVAFPATVAGRRTADAILVGAPGRPLHAIAVAGGLAPDIAGGTISGLDAPALNDRGDVAFLATVQRGRDRLGAIYLVSAGRWHKIAAQGDPSPLGGSYAGFGVPAVNSHGTVAFGAVIDGADALGALFLADPRRRVRKAVATGDGSPIGGFFEKFSEHLALNDHDELAFHALVNGGHGAAGIFVVAGAGIRAVATVGAPAPGAGHFAGFGPWPALADDGSVAFIASVDDEAPPTGVFLSTRAGALERVVAAGQPSPAGPIASFGLYPVVSISGRRAIAFATAPTASTAGAEAILVAEPTP